MARLSLGLKSRFSVNFFGAAVRWHLENRILVYQNKNRRVV